MLRILEPGAELTIVNPPKCHLVGSKKAFCPLIQPNRLMRPPLFTMSAAKSRPGWLPEASTTTSMSASLEGCGEVVSVVL